MSLVSVKSKLTTPNIRLHVCNKIIILSHGSAEVCFSASDPLDVVNEHFRGRMAFHPLKPHSVLFYNRNY